MLSLLPVAKHFVVDGTLLLTSQHEYGSESISQFSVQDDWGVFLHPDQCFRIHMVPPENRVGSILLNTMGVMIAKCR